MASQDTREIVFTEHIVQKIADNYEITESKAAGILSDILESIIEHVANDKVVKFRLFGKFEKRDTPARKGRCFVSGQTIDIAPSAKPVFDPFSKFKEDIKKTYSNSEYDNGN